MQTAGELAAAGGFFSGTRLQVPGLQAIYVMVGSNVVSQEKFSDYPHLVFETQDLAKQFKQQYEQFCLNSQLKPQVALVSLYKEGHLRLEPIDKSDLHKLRCAMGHNSCTVILAEFKKFVNIDNFHAEYREVANYSASDHREDNCLSKLL